MKQNGNDFVSSKPLATRKAETGYLPCAYPDGNIPGEAGDEAGSGDAADAAAAIPGAPGVPGEAADAVPGEPPA